MSPVNFNIEQKGIVSQVFLEKNIHTFQTAGAYIAALPYQRNSYKDDILCPIHDQKGTCSTKHAVLRKLALEHHRPDIQLQLAIIQMDAVYAPKIADILEQYHLDFIPEAHVYLQYRNQLMDFTYPNATVANFQSNILYQENIEYDQINDYKTNLHKTFLENWAPNNTIYDIHTLWRIRENCIAALQG